MPLYNIHRAIATAKRCKESAFLDRETRFLETGTFRIRYLVWAPNYTRTNSGITLRPITESHFSSRFRRNIRITLSESSRHRTRASITLSVSRSRLAYIRDWTRDRGIPSDFSRFEFALEITAGTLQLLANAQHGDRMREI
jgi:hypothetical protein